MSPKHLALAFVWLAPSPAHAEAGDVELSLTSEGIAFVSDTVAATTNGGMGFSPSLRVGWSPVDPLTVSIGWRAMTAISRSDRGYDLTTSGDAVVLAARYSLGLHPNFDLHAELDLEAMHADFELEIGGHHGSTSAWSLGAVPKLVASARTDLGPFTFDFRLFGGFAARTNLSADGLRLSSGAPADQVARLDLGSVNLSGVVFGANFALVF